MDAIDLTGRLDAALEVDDMKLCQDILEIRGFAMANFESWHRTSSQDELEKCQDLIRELAVADNNLQARFKEGLESSAVDLRNLVTSGARAPSSAYTTHNISACVDRKA